VDAASTAKTRMRFIDIPYPGSTKPATPQEGDRLADD
jgi:hypothetical protein